MIPYDKVGAEIALDLWWEKYSSVHSHHCLILHHGSDCRNDGIIAEWLNYIGNDGKDSALGRSDYHSCNNCSAGGPHGSLISWDGYYYEVSSFKESFIESVT